MSKDPFFSMKEGEEQNTNVQPSEQTHLEKKDHLDDVQGQQNSSGSSKSDIGWKKTIDSPSSPENPERETQEAEKLLEEKLQKVDQPHPTKKVTTPHRQSRHRGGKRMSFKALMRGCLGFLILLVGGVSTVFYSMLSNPNQEWTIIPRQSAQDLLITFARLFFVILFFVGVFFLTINVTRRMSKKRAKKFPYVIGTAIGLIFIILSVAIGIPTINKIKQAGHTTINRIVDPYMMLPNGATSMANTDKLIVIAPATIFYQLNTDVYKSKILLPLGSPDIKSLTLQCGNGQELAYNNQSNGFGNCLYIQKKNYPVSLSIEYTDRQTGEMKQESIKLADMKVVASIHMEVANGERYLNDKKDEIILGDAPIKLLLDAQDIITRFGLKTNDINRDMDADEDETFEIQQTAIVKKQFIHSQLYTIKYQLPSLSPYTYSMQLRVMQPKTPICQVSITPQSDTVYSFDVSFVEGREKVSQYEFTVKDLLSNKVVYDEKVKSNHLKYDFLHGGQYAVRATFITPDGKKSSCESDDFQIGDISYRAQYDLSIKTPIDKKFADISSSDDTITLSQLPSVLRFQDIQIFPRTQDTQITLLLDGEAVLPTQGTSFDVEILSQGEHTIQIQAVDMQTERTSIVKTITIQTDLQGVIGKLLVRPDTVGTEPFEVEFDASTTKINDPDDEVVYFTRDFGDGEVKRNINQAIIKHTYHFDEEVADGRYNPKLTMTTKKGRTLTVELDQPIIVKRALREAHIAIDSHPGQVATVGESVRFSLAMDGSPRRVKWTFSPEDTLECSGRECMEASRVFNQAGVYHIHVSVEYDDHPDISDEVQLLIK